MLINKYFIQLILFYSLLNFSYITFAKTFKKTCGNYTYKVKILHKDDKSRIKFRLYSQNLQGENKLFYETAQGHLLFAACVKTTQNNYLMIFQDIQGLNGEPEDTYGVYDPLAAKILINPSNWPHGNQKIVEKLLGYEPPILLLGNDPYFCCHPIDYESLSPDPKKQA